MTKKPFKTSLYKAKYNNKAQIEVVYYHRQVKGCVDADRIQLLVTSQEGKKRGWMMTVLEAQDIIIGLSKASSIAIEDKIPLFYENN